MEKESEGVGGGGGGVLERACCNKARGVLNNRTQIIHMGITMPII